MHPLESKLNYRFQNPQLLSQALTHRSAIREAQNTASELLKADNQRLEYLGDATLQLLIAEALFERHPEENEGILTQLRACCVNTKSLAQIAQSLELGEYLYLGLGEQEAGGREKASALADVFEAVVGALYLDAGWLRCKEMILPFFEQFWQQQPDTLEHFNPKGELQEILQNIHPQTPVYQTKKSQGPSHEPEFFVEVFWRGVVIGSGKGRRKKTAEAEAARDALMKKHWED